MAYSGRSGSRKPGGNSNNRGRSGGRDSKPAWKRGGSGSSRSGSSNRSSSSDDDRPAFKKKSFGGDRDGFKKKSFGDKPGFSKRSPSDKRRRDDDDRPKKSFGDKPAFRKRREDSDDRPGFKKKSFARPDERPFGRGDKPGFKRRRDDDDRPKKSFGDKPAFRKRREDGDERPGFKKKSFGDKPFGERGGFKGKRRDDDRGGFKKRSFGDDKKPSWKKGSRDESSFTDRKRSDKRTEGDGDWQTFENESASEYVKKSLPKKSHRGQAGKGSYGEDDGDGKIRLNKYIANTGLCSRREADEMIEAGVIKVNGKIVTELGTKINPTDIVHYGDQPLKREKLVYVLLNKPKDYITTTDDPQERKTVLDLVSGAGDERIYPVGRLDRNTTGVLLLTNDGDLAERLMHPKYGVEKIYQVSLDMNLRKEDFDKILEGIELEDGFIKADDLSFVGDGSDHKEIGIVLHSGRNRIVRRMFEQLGYTVKGLDRVGYAGLTKKNVPKGKWRFLEPREVGFLKMKVGGEKKRSKF